MLCDGSVLLKVARANGFAVPAFNISDWDMMLGVVAAAEAENAPVILEIHPDELSHIGVDFMPSALVVAAKSSVPVGVHLDHGASFADVVVAVRHGFTSAMFDGSMLPFEENVAITAKSVEVAHIAGVAVEAELGTIGAMDQYGEGGSDKVIYTVPEDARRFVELTNVDSLAIAIGTYHGLYPADIEPHLRIDLLKEIADAVTIPLVLHGGSNNPDDEIAESVQYGISKINISSDIKSAYFIEMRKVLEDEGVREPNVIVPSCVAKMQEVAIHKMRLFRASGKASLYM